MTTTFLGRELVIAAVLDETTRRKGCRAIRNSGQFRKNLTTISLSTETSCPLSSLVRMLSFFLSKVRVHRAAGCPFPDDQPVDHERMVVFPSPFHCRDPVDCRLLKVAWLALSIPSI
jgi:hypothetical protein